MGAGLCFVPGEASASSVGWQPAVWLQNDENYEQCEALGMDDYGNAMVMWEEPFTNYSDPGIFAVRYDALTGWEETVKVWNASFWCGATTMAMGSEGDAFILLRAEIDTETSGVFAIRYDPGSGWIEQALIAETEYGGDMAITVDGDGNAVAVWAELSTLYAADYSPGDDWTAPYLLDDSGTWPHVMFDRQGNAMAVWDGSDTAQVESKTYDPVTGWGPLMIASGTLEGYDAELEVNDTGHAMVTWLMYNGTAREMYSSFYAPGVGWGTPEQIGPVDGGWHPGGGSMAAGSDGEFFLIWQQADAYEYPYNWSVWVRTWSAGSGWEEGTMLRSGPGTSWGLYATISANDAGQAIAIWTESDETDFDVVACMYAPGVGWGGIDNVGGESTEHSWLGQAALAPNGDAVLTIREYVSGDNRLWGKEYFALERPDLAVTTPVDGTVTEEPSVEVSGMTDPGATVTINGTEIDVGTGGSFSVTFALSAGVNEILVVATIEGQGSTGVLIEVTFDDPIAELLAQIDDLMDEIDELTALVEEQQISIEVYEAYIDLLYEAFLVLGEEYETILTELEETNQALNESQDESAAMEDDIAAFEDEVSSLEDCMAGLEDNITELESTVAEQEDDASAAKVLQYALIAVIGVLALAVVLLLVQNSKLRKGRGP
jgi:uncharacterized coiled-coil protein SlyX